MLSVFMIIFILIASIYIFRHPVAPTAIAN